MARVGLSWVDPEARAWKAYICTNGTSSDRPPVAKFNLTGYDSPANTALGKFPSLLPIVIATKTHADALVVDELRATLDRQGIERNDYSALRAFFASTEISELLTKYDKFYAIRVGKETGIWIDYPW